MQLLYARLRLFPVFLLCWLVAAAFRADNPGLEIHAFKANADEKARQVKLSWKAKALGNYSQWGYFYVERSADGATWSRLNAPVQFWVSPKLEENFSFTDQLNEAERYYRLISVDNNRKETPLATTHYELKKALLFCEFTLHRDIGKVYMNYLLDRQKELLVRVYDGIGQQVWTEKLPSGEPGTHAFLLDVSRFRKGVYLLVVTQVEDDMNIVEHRLDLR